jgi:intracellular sulfur oxidation DsrE/DsrF family protein
MSGRNGLATTLTAAALVVVLGSTMLDLRRVAGEMETALANQTKALEGSRKIETQLDALAKGVGALADAGNPNAQAIVAALKQNGVTIKPDG